MKSIKLSYVIVMLVVAIVGTFIVTDQLSAGSVADTSQPGSVQDPLVTKTYVDQKLQALVQAEVAKAIPSPTPTPTPTPKPSPTPSPSPTATPAPTSTNVTLKIVTLSINQRLMLGANAEIIVRAGTVRVYSAVTGASLLDVTSARDLKVGTIVPANHLLVIAFPGRGVKAAGTSTIMVRGAYTKYDARGKIVETRK